MKNKFFILFSLLLICEYSFSQEKKKFKDVVNIYGYVKYLPSTSFTNTNDMMFDHLIHNRVNIKTYISNTFTARLDVRNRMFFVETVNATPFYGQFVDIDNGEVDMSFLLIDEEKVIVHSIIDRAYLDFSKGKWEIRAGRQRINWGINLAWNANDLFNAYNIADFDYQERPGSDALRVQYFTGDVSHIELAYKPGENIDKSIIAGLFKFNAKKYDFQIITANYYTDYAFGGGWAGNIKNAGFKGEGTYFLNKENLNDTIGTTSISTSIDYSFKNETYINASFLFNSSGQDSLGSSSSPFPINQLTAKSLMPSKYSYFAQIAKSFAKSLNPLFNSNLSIIYGQGMNTLFIMPSLSYAPKENWDLSITGQLYYGEEQSSFKNLGNSIFLRFQFNY
jgi:hypothetical protein